VTAAPAAVTVNLDGFSKDVLPSFLGISHEWVDVSELVDPEAIQLLKDLAAYGTGPLVLRVGGGSTDLQKQVPDGSVWDTLRQLNQEIGMKFILGVNFEAGNWELARQQVEAIRKELPGDSVLGLELGNEVCSAACLVSVVVLL